MLAALGFFALVFLIHAVIFLLVWDFLVGDDED